MKIYLMIICLITCLNMQGSEVITDLQNFFNTTTGKTPVALIPIPTNNQQLKTAIEQKFPNTKIVVANNTNDLTLENLNTHLDSVQKKPAIIFFPRELINQADLLTTNLNTCRMNFSAQRFDPLNPIHSQSNYDSTQINYVKTTLTPSITTQPSGVFHNLTAA